MGDLLNGFGSALKGLLSSKKAIVAIAGVVIASAGRIGLNLPEDATTQIVGVLMAFLIGQGLADFGKESVKP